MAYASTLTPTLQETLDLLALGLSNAEIAERLGKKPGTVKNRLEVIYMLLGVRNRTEAAVHWREKRG